MIVNDTGELVVYSICMEQQVSKRTLEVMEESYLNDLEMEIVRPLDHKRFVGSGVFIFLVVLTMSLIGFLVGIVLGVVM